MLDHTGSSGETDARDEEQVAVLDAHTGALLGQIPIPKKGGYQVNDVADGVISVFVPSASGGYVKLLAE